MYSFVVIMAGSFLIVSVPQFMLLGGKDAGGGSKDPYDEALGTDRQTAATWMSVHVHS